VAADYHRLGNTTEPATLLAAWNKLSESEQQRIIQIVNCNAQPDTQGSHELSACATKIQLESVKAEYGEVLSRQAWRLLHNTSAIRFGYFVMSRKSIGTRSSKWRKLGTLRAMGRKRVSASVRNPLYKAEPQPQPNQHNPSAPCSHQ